MKCCKVVICSAILLVSYSCSTVADKSKDDNVDPVVTVKQGQLKGLVLESRKGNKYFGFLGVPYGKVPARFEAPQAPDEWAGVKDSTKHVPHCFQFCVVTHKLIGVENCLTFDIYTPKLDGNYPVIVQIHGGGFQYGGSSFFNGKYFMDEQVVLVSLQYRLGALGFLNTGDDVVPGNMGLKDQNQALKWIQENIAQFGGNKNKVTILGFSCGGASVHYHMISPMSTGLFSSAISQSGSVLNPWAYQPNPTKYTNLLAKNLGCTGSSEEVIKCLQAKPVSDILDGQLSLSIHPHEFDLISMLFVPSVERSTTKPKFLHDTPYKLVSTGQLANVVPWIAGVTKDEGGFYTALIMENDTSLDIINKDWMKMSPNIFYYENTATSPAQDEVSQKVWDYYFGKGKITTGVKETEQFANVFGDRFFVTGVSRAIKEYVKNTNVPVYPYIFSYAIDESITQTMLHTKNTYGVVHAEDLKYMFNETCGAPDYSLDTKEGKFSKKYVKLLVSFATDGKPTETWGDDWEAQRFTLGPHSIHDMEIMWYDIDEENTMLDYDPFKERTDFWESLPLRESFKEDLQRDEL